MDTPGSARIIFGLLEREIGYGHVSGLCGSGHLCRGPVWRCEGQVHISGAGAKPGFPDLDLADLFALTFHHPPHIIEDFRFGIKPKQALPDILRLLSSLP